MAHRNGEYVRAAFTAAAFSLAGCGGGAGAGAEPNIDPEDPDTVDTDAPQDTDAPVEPDDDTDAGECAAALGLYADSDCQVLAAGVMQFAPQFPLWSDAVSKERYVFLPPGETIDVRDPDAWVFPVGTRFWKHFQTKDGVRLETRILEKTADLKGEPGWSFETYAWNEAGDDVTRVTEGRRDVLGTEHDIPEESDCSECHSGGDNDWDSSLGQDQLLDLALGFGAIQLNHEGSQTTVQSLITDGWLDGTVSLTDAVVPGEATARAALGYLHANCGSCHGGAKPAKRLTMLIPVGTPRVEDAPVYQDTVNEPTDPNDRATGVEDMPPTRIVPGDPENSALVWRMRQRGGDDAPMPPLATDVVDEDGVEAVSAWIEDLQ